MRNAAISAMCVAVVIAGTMSARPAGAREAPATKTPSPRDELNRLIRAMTKLRGKEYTQSAGLALARIDGMIPAAEKCLDFATAAFLAGKGAAIARTIGSVRQRDYSQQAAEYRRLDRMGGQIRLLTATVENKPNNTDARTVLVRIYMVHLDDPAAATKLLTGDLEEELRTIVGLSQKRMSQLGATELLGLGNWYADATGATTLRALRRARAYYLAFLEKADKHDETYVKVRRRLARVLKLLDSVSPPVVGRVLPGKPWRAAVYVRKGDYVTIAAGGSWDHTTREDRDGGMDADREGRLTPRIPRLRLDGDSSDEESDEPGYSRHRTTVTIYTPEGRKTKDKNSKKQGGGDYCLAGRIGEKYPFKVGASWTGTAETTGALSMMIPGAPREHVSGRLTVVIRKYPPIAPEAPAQAANKNRAERTRPRLQD